MKAIKLDSIIKIYKGKKANLLSATHLSNCSRFIQIDDLRNDTNIKFTDSKGIFVEPEDIIIAWDGANAGTIGYGLSGIIGSTLAKLELQTDDVLPQYLGRFLKSKFRYLRDKCTGATIPHISKQVLENLEIPCPSLEDQKRIVKILDQADSLRHKRKQALEMLDDYLKSVFLEMFGDPEKNNKEWNKLFLKDTVDIQSGQVNPRNEPYASMIHIGGADIESGTGKILKKISARDAGQISGKYLFDQNYLLYSKIRPYLNKVSLPDFNGICSADIYPIKPKEILNKYFLAYILKSNVFLEYANKNSGRANIPKINRNDLLKYKIIVPPTNLQNTFEEKWRKIEDLKQKMTFQSQELEIQFRALMQKAFATQKIVCLSDVNII